MNHPATREAEAPIQLAHEPPFRLGAAEARPATREFVAPEGTQLLQPRVMQVLVALYRAGGEVVTRDQLMARCWSGRIVGEDALTRVIGKLHHLAEQADGGRAFKLDTIRGVGYRLTAEAGASRVDPLQSGPARRRFSWPFLAGTLAVVLIALIGGGLWLLRADRGPAAPAEPPTVAVLPFENFSPVQADAFLAAGVARELRNTLSRVHGLRVIADSSAFAAAGRGLEPRQIGRRLDADLLVDGSVARSGALLRVSVELIDGRSGAQVWTETLEDPAGDLLAVQEAAAAALIKELARSGSARLRSPPPARPRNLDAHVRVLQAQELFERHATLAQNGRLEETAHLAAQAEALLEEALRLDPRDAKALVLKARSYRRELTQQPGSELLQAERNRVSATLVDRALTYDPNEPLALVALAERDYRETWNWDRAEALLRRALAVEPNNADAHTWLAYLLATQGRCLEGLKHARSAAALDPEWLWRRLAIPRLLVCAGRRSEAKQSYRAELARDPGNLFLLREIYLNRLVENDAPGLRVFADEVEETLWRGREPPPRPRALLERMRAAADALEGRPGALLAMVEAEAEARSKASAPRVEARRSRDLLWTFAVESAWAGDTERAIAFLQQAVALGSLYISETLPYGAYEFTPEVRADPRYQALWSSDPRLVELKARRLQAVQSGQSVGRLPAGRTVRPAKGACQAAAAESSAPAGADTVSLM